MSKRCKLVVAEVQSERTSRSKLGSPVWHIRAQRLSSEPWSLARFEDTVEDLQVWGGAARVYQECPGEPTRAVYDCEEMLRPERHRCGKLKRFERVRWTRGRS